MSDLTRLTLRRPRRVWAIAGASGGVSVAALAATILLVVFETTMDPSRAADPHLATDAARALAGFVGLGLAAAGVVGAPWLIATRGRSRIRRLHIVAEGAGVAALSALALGLGVGVFAAGQAIVGDAPGPAWRALTEAGLGSALVIGVLGAFAAAPFGAMAGAVMALLAFSRPSPAVLRRRQLERTREALRQRRRDADAAGAPDAAAPKRAAPPPRKQRRAASPPPLDPPRLRPATSLPESPPEPTRPAAASPSATGSTVTSPDAASAEAVRPVTTGVEAPVAEPDNTPSAEDLAPLPMPSWAQEPQADEPQVDEPQVDEPQVEAPPARAFQTAKPTPVEPAADPAPNTNMAPPAPPDPSPSAAEAPPAPAETPPVAARRPEPMRPELENAGWSEPTARRTKSTRDALRPTRDPKRP